MNAGRPHFVVRYVLGHRSLLAAVPPFRAALARTAGTCPRHPRLSQVDRLLRCGAVQSFFTGSRRPACGGPRALAATGRRRSLSPPPLRQPPATQRAVPPSQTARPGSDSPSPSTRSTTRSRPILSRHGPAVPVAAVSKSRDVADAGTGLLETHVTGARSAGPPPWLTFGGAGQNCAANEGASTALLSNSATTDRGCSRTRIRARRPPRYHRHRGPDQGFRDRTTRNAVEAEGWSGLLLLSSARRWRETGPLGFGVRSGLCPPRRWWAGPPAHG